jgi:hypothetical protein
MAKMTAAQETALRDLCERYKVEFNSADYFVQSESAFMAPGYAEGWVGGFAAGKIYVGVDPEGRVNS